MYNKRKEKEIHRRVGVSLIRKVPEAAPFLGRVSYRHN